MTAQTALFTFRSAEETAGFASALSAELGAGDTVLLSGAVGAGKTHFARHLIQAILREPEDVPSPTFTLIQTYETKAGPLWHADLYRISSPYEIEELGLADAFETNICLVEWPDRLGTLAPQDALLLDFAQGRHDKERQVTASWTSDRWRAPLHGWAAA